MLAGVTTTRAAAGLRGLKLLVYGQAGMGKTTLCATTPGPFIVSAEAGLLSLRGYDIPCREIATLKDLQDVFAWFANSNEPRQYNLQTICLDSISEIAEKVLTNAKATNKDVRAAYGVLIEQMMATVRMFRDLPGYNVYMSAKMESSKDEVSGGVMYGPSMPGAKLGPQLPYLFDEVFALRVAKTQDGQVFRYLQTTPDLQYTAKDRSGALAPMEPPNLGAIFNKIMGN